MTCSSQWSNSGGDRRVLCYRPYGFKAPGYAPWWRNSGQIVTDLPGTDPGANLFRDPAPCQGFKSIHWRRAGS